MAAPATVHRMADPAVRLRVLAMLVALIALAWVSVTLAARGGGAFAPAELRDLSGVPVQPPQISGRVQPGAPGIDDLSRQFEELRRRVGGVRLPPGLAPEDDSQSAPRRGGGDSP